MKVILLGNRLVYSKINNNNYIIIAKTKYSCEHELCWRATKGQVNLEHKSKHIPPFCCAQNNMAMFEKIAVFIYVVMHSPSSN